MGDEDPKVDGDTTEFTTESRWPLGGDSDNVYFFGTDRESGILSDFGWNLRPDTAEHSDGQFDRIASEILAGDSSNNGAGREAEIELPARQASGGHVSTSSSEDQPENPTASGCASDDKSPSGSACKVKKKGLKRMKQPRFAFMTKSEVDHLEDGYRWRKYGQKAVKNSPFPRSYYRCTNSKCTVKKRVERSYEDPTVVITTYEGQHCHYTVGFPRVVFANQLAPSASRFSYGAVLFPQETNPPPQGHYQVAAGVFGASNVLPEPAPQPPTDEGLLGDIVPGIRNRTR